MFEQNNDLVEAAKAGDLDRVRKIVSDGADKTIKSSEGKVPLDLATDHNRPSDVLELLGR